MANIGFVGFVEPWTEKNEQHPAWGMKVVELHSRKVDGSDKWEVVGRTWRTVKAGYGVELDFTQFKKGDRVRVEGTESTETREHEGKKYYTLTVKATRVGLEGAKAGQGSSAVASVDDGAPF